MYYITADHNITEELSIKCTLALSKLARKMYAIYLLIYRKLSVAYVIFYVPLKIKKYFEQGAVNAAIDHWDIVSV